jgi:hypothetical protein
MKKTLQGKILYSDLSQTIWKSAGIVTCLRKYKLQSPMEKPRVSMKERKKEKVCKPKLVLALY